MNDQQIIQSIGDMANSLTELGDVVQTSLPVLLAAPFIMYAMLLIMFRLMRR